MDTNNCDMDETDSINADELYMRTEKKFAAEPSLVILKDLQNLYEERLAVLQRKSNEDPLHLQSVNGLLKCWVADLTEQIALLVRAVEDLEEEAIARIRITYEQRAIERRRHSEVLSELTAEKAVLQRALARKDSDMRGLVEVLRRLRELDSCSLEGIHFFEVTESDIFGSMDWRKLKDRGDKHDTKKKKIKIAYEE